MICMICINKTPTPPVYVLFYRTPSVSLTHANACITFYWLIAFTFQCICDTHVPCLWRVKVKGVYRGAGGPAAPQ